MELKFVISKEALFTTALLKSTEIEGWVDLQNELWDKYKLGYELLQGNATNIFADENSQDTLNKATQEVKLLIEDGMKSDKFTLLLKNAEGYKSWLENEWSSNKQNVEKELSDILKVDLPKDVFTVYVMGDLVRVGRHLGKNKLLGVIKKIGQTTV